MNALLKVARRFDFSQSMPSRSSRRIKLNMAFFKSSLVVLVVALLSGSHQAPQAAFFLPYPYPINYGPAAYGQINGRLNGGLMSAFTATRFTTSTVTSTYTYSITCSRKIAGPFCDNPNAVPFPPNFARSLLEAGDEQPAISPSEIVNR